MAMGVDGIRAELFKTDVETASEIISGLTEYETKGNRWKTGNRVS